MDANDIGEALFFADMMAEENKADDIDDGDLVDGLPDTPTQKLSLRKAKEKNMPAFEAYVLRKCGIL